MRFLFLMCMLLVGGSQLLCGQTVNVNGVNVAVSSEQLNADNSRYNLSTCRQSFVSFQLNNTTSSAVSDFSITTEANTGVLMLFDLLSDPNLSVDVATRKITILSLPVGASTIQVPIKASCQNFDSTATHTSISTLNFIYQNGTPTKTQSINFFISSGVISYIASDDFIEPVQNITYTGHKGDIFTREYNFKITSSNFSGVLHFEEIIPSDRIEIVSLQLIVDGESKWTVSSNLIDPVSGKLIRDIVLDDVRVTAEIQILEVVKIIGCPTSTGSVNMTYGCEGSSCISYREMEVTTVLGPEVPNIVITDMNPHTFGTCLTSPNNTIARKFRLKNEGTAPASNVKARFKATSNGVFPVNIVPASSFAITAIPDVMSLTEHTQGSTTSLSAIRKLSVNGAGDCFNNDLLLLLSEDITISLLKAGEYIDIEWQEQTCCVSNTEDNNYELIAYGFDNVKCDDECGTTPLGFAEKLTSDRAILTPLGQAQTSVINNMMGCFICPAGNCAANASGTCDDNVLKNASSPDDDYTEVVKIKNSALGFGVRDDQNFPIDYQHFRLVVDFAAEKNLLLAPQSLPLKRGNIMLKDGKGNPYYPISQTALTPSQILEVFGTSAIPANASDAGARAVFEIDPAVIFGPGADLTTYRSKSLQAKLAAFLNSLETSFEVSGVCSRWPEPGRSNFYERMYLVPDGDDCPECRLSLGNYVSYITVNCPGCVYPGVLVGSYNVERVTLGLPDADNNGLPDAPGVVGTGSPNLKMVTDNDIFKTTTTSKLWGGDFRTYGSGQTIGTLEQDFNAPRFLTNLCRLDMIAAYGEFFDGIVDSNHPIVLNYTRGLNTYEFKFESNNQIATSDGNGNFLFQFPVTLIRQMLQSSPYNWTAADAAAFNYQTGDISEISVYYKVKPDFDLGAEFYKPIDVSNRCFYSDRLKNVLISDESDPESPYGVAGQLKEDRVNELRPYLNYICEAYGAVFMLADIKNYMSYAGSGTGNAPGCQKGLGVVQTISGKSDYDLYDLFPYEVRNFNRVTKMRYVVAKGYRVTGDSYILSRKSFKPEGSFDFVSYNEYKSFKEIPASHIVSKGPAYETHNGTPVLVGEIFEVDFEYNDQLTYNSNPISDWLTSGKKFADGNEFSTSYLELAFAADCSEGMLDAFIYTDNLSERADPGFNFITKFPLQGPLAYIQSYDNNNQAFSSTLTPSGSTTAHSWYDRPWTSPFVRFDKTQANIDVYRKESKIPFNITALMPNMKLFMYFTTKNGKVILKNLIKSNNETIVPIDGIYQLGTLGGATINFNLGVEFQCNAITDDELYVHIGYTCDDDYPKFENGQLSKPACGTLNETIRIIESRADMKLDYTAAANCTNIIHELKMTALEDGGLYDFKPSITLPSNITYTAASAKLMVYEIVNNQPVALKNTLGIPFVFPLEPSNPAAGVLSWDFTDVEGLDDIYIHKNIYAALTFETQAPCGATSGVVTATATSATYCNTVISKDLINPYTITYATPCTNCCVAIASAGVDQEGCWKSEGYTLTAGNVQPGFTYTWTAGSNIYSGSTVTVYPTMGLTTTYTLTVTSATEENCTATDEVDVQVFSGPEIHLTTSDGRASVLVNGCRSSVTLQTIANSNYTYQWSRMIGYDYVAISGATNSSYEVTMGNAGNYMVTVTDITTTCTSSSWVAVVDEMTIDGKDQICPGEDPGLSLSIPGLIGDYLVQWIQDGGDFTDTPSGLAGNYYAVVVLQNPLCTLYSESKQVVLLPRPSPYTITGGDKNYCEDDYLNGITLTAHEPVSTDTPIKEWSWSTGGSNTTNTVHQSGVYYINVIGDNGCTNSSHTSLVSPCISISQQCNVDGTTTLVASTNIPGVFTYSWIKNGSPIVIGTGKTITVSEDGTYQVITPDLLCYTVKQAVVCRNLTVTELELREDFNITGIAEPCNDPIMQNKTDLDCINPNIALGMGEGDYKWIGKTRITQNAATEITDAGANGLWTGLPYLNTRDASDNYFLASDGPITTEDRRLWHTTVTVENCATYMFTAMVKNLLTAKLQELPDVYLRIGDTRLTQAIVFADSDWRQLGGSWKSNITGPLEIAIVLKKGGFVGRDIGVDEVLFTKTDCSQLTTEQCRAIAEVGIDKYICTGASIEIGDNKLTPGLTYSWTAGGVVQSTEMNPTVSPTVTTEYLLTVTDPVNHCTAANTMTVTINEPSINVSAVSCGSDFKADRFNGVGSVEYAWYVNGTLRETNTRGLFHPIGLTSGDKVKCQLLSTCTSKPFSDEVTVLPSSSLEICKGASITIGCDPEPGATYSWSPATGLSSSTVAKPVASPIASTTYTLTKTIAGIVTTSNFTVNISSAPVFNSVTANPTQVCLGETSHLSVSVSGGLPPFTYVWKRPNTTGGTIIVGTTQEVDVTPVPYQPSTYRPTVTDKNGCEYVSTLTVNVTASTGPPIGTGNVGNTTKCAGSSATITYSLAPCTSFNPGNVFTAQLSGPGGGDFSNPVDIGSVVSTTMTPIPVVIPATTIPGIYTIRIVSSDNPYIGSNLYGSTVLTITAPCNAVRFDGVDDRITIPNSAAYNLGLGDFTMEAKITASSSSNSQSTILSNRGSVIGGTFMWVLYNGGKQMIMQINGVNLLSASFPTLYDNACHHLAVTRINGQVRFYVDGIDKGSYNTASMALNTTYPLLIGYDAVDGNSKTFKGVISQVRLWNTAINIPANMNAQVPGNAGGLIGMWLLQDTGAGQMVYDTKISGNNGWRGTNATLEDAQDPSKETGVACTIPPPSTGLTFDGLDDRVTIPVPSPNPYGLSNFTIEVWLRMPTGQTIAPTIISNRSNGSNGFALIISNGGKQLRALMNGQSYSNTNNFPGINGIFDNACHHIAMTKSSGTIRFYLDGVLYSVANTSSLGLGNGSQPFWIGGDVFAGGPGTFKGNINELRIWNVARSGTDIFNSRTTPLVMTAPNLIGHWRFQEASGQVLYDGSTTVNHAYLGSNATLVDVNDPARSTASCYATDKASDEEMLSFDLTPEEQEVHIYPNPFEKETYMVVNGEVGERSLVKITDLNGIQVEELMVINNEKTAIARQLRGGIYIVEVISEQGRSLHKIIKVE